MRRKLRNGEKIRLYLILTLIGILMLMPFVYMISISLISPQTNAKMLFTVLPQELHFQNYIRVFTDERILRWFMNSVVLVVFCMIGQVMASSFVAFGFARLNYKYKKVLFMILLATMMIPQQITLIPQFIIFTKLKWVNTLLPIIVPNFAGGAYNIFLCRQIIMTIPQSLDDAAKIDGLGYIGIYFKMILPLIKPVLAVIAIFTFNYNWGAFMEPLIYIEDKAKMPLALGVQILSATSSVGATPEWNIVMVSSLLLTLPMIIIFILNQRRIFELNVGISSDVSK